MRGGEEPGDGGPGGPPKSSPRDRVTPPHLLRGSRELLGVLASWQGELEQLMDLPRRKPPGKLKFADLERLAKERYAKREHFLDVEDELAGEAPMISKSNLITKLEAVTRLAVDVKDFSIMLREVLALYGEEAAEVTERLGLSETWQQQGLEEYTAISRRWDMLARVAIPELGGRRWREVWASLGEGEQHL